MHVKRSTLLLFVLLFVSYRTAAQPNFCPPNVGFENGNFANWLLYTGTCCPIVANTLTGPVVNRHVITTNGTDPYGGFPVVSPGGGNHSMKLGNNSTGAQAERARFYVHVPAGTSNYSLIYRYAVVFQDPGHDPSEQPRFQVTARDSATNQILPCADFLYVAASSLPGFQLSTVGQDVRYKTWTTATLNLSGWEGHTIAIDFMTGDCLLTAHFGYGYVDMSCGLFEVSGFSCNSPTTTFTAPPGFETYTWYNDSYSTVVGTGQTVTLPTPQNTSTYHVILTPFNGYGCPDTLHTTLNVSNINLTASNDTTVCQGSSVPLHASATGNFNPNNFNWTPSTGLSCTNCANPVATVANNTSYYVTVTDNNGCSKTDTVNVNVTPQTNISISSQNVSCNGMADGSATATATGVSPFVYTWNTTPQQTTPTASGLAPGTYTITVGSANNCPQTGIVTITQPNTLTATMSSTPDGCSPAPTGSASVVAAGGTAPYNYSWNTAPIQTTSTATNLPSGPRTVTVTDAHGCIATGTTNVGQLNSPTATITNLVNGTCSTIPTGQATVSGSGGTPPYTYSWNTNPVQTTPTAIGLGSGIYIATITDANGCTDTVHAQLTQSGSPSISTTSTNVSCNGGFNGTISITANGGTAPYTYSWNNGQTTANITGLSAGTYTVSVADNLGCIATGSVTITQPAALNATLNTINNVSCNGGNNGSTGMTVTGGTPAYTYTWNTVPQQTTPNIGNLPAGTFTGIVTDNKGCKDTVIATVQQPAQLLAVVPNPINASCGQPNGSAPTVVIGGTAPYTYSWNTTPLQTSQTATGLGSGTYVVTVTDAHGCIDTAHAVIQQSPTLSLATNVTNVTCNGAANGIASVSPNTGTAPFTYNWSNGQSTSSINSLAPGTYTVNVSDNQGCSATGTVTITQPNALNAIIANVTNLSCYGSNNGSATMAVLGGSPSYTYTWNTVPVQTTNHPINLPPGSYSGIVTDSHGCKDTVSVNITQPSQLDVTVTNPNNATCGLPNGSATAVASGGTAPFSYSWNTTPGQTDSIADNLTAGTYVVTVTDNNGCIDNTTVTLTQTPAVYATTTPHNVSCHGLTDGSITASTSGGTQPISYTWSNSQTGLTINNLSAGIYTFIATDNIGCSDTSVVTITEPATLITDLTNVENVKCFGSHDGSATVVANGGTQPYSFLWNTGGSTPNPNNLDTGDHTVIITDAHGCADTQSLHLTQPPQLFLTAQATSASCSGQPTGSAEAAGVGGNPPYDIIWNSNPPQSGTTATSLPAGTYTVTLTDANGCMKTNTVNIPAMAQPTVNAGPDKTFCNGKDTLILSASGTQTYQWTPAATVICPTCATTGADPAGTTTYTVTGTDEFGCSATDEVTITVYTKEPMSVGDDIDICIGGSAQITANGGAQYQWTPSPEGNESNSSFTVTPESSMSYTVIIYQNECFSDTLTQKVNVWTYPTIALGPDQKVLPGTVVTIPADTTHALSITWDPATNLSCDDCTKPTATIDNTITYTATAYNKACKATDDITFMVACTVDNIFMPNTFTPNSDGNNDVFFPQTPGSNPIKLFRVYNRWGQMLHERTNFVSNDPHYGWDGTYEGKTLSPDVYVYFLETTCPDGDRVFKKGDISLLK